MSYYTDKELGRVWAPDLNIELGPVEVSKTHLVSCDGCKRKLRRMRPLIIAWTEFTMCGACLKRIAKVVSA